MIDLKKLGPSLKRGEDGIWYSPRSRTVSYPDEGNALYAQIEEDSFWFRHRNRCIRSMLETGPPATPFLDIGAGNGFVALAIQEAGIEVAALDAGLQGVAKARARGIDPVICSTLEESGLAAGSFAAAGLFDVLEHVEDDAGFLRRVRQLLQNQGRLYVTVPAYSFLWSSEDIAVGHFRRYTQRSLTRALTSGGFEVEFASAIFASLVAPIFLFRALPSALGIRLAETLGAYRRIHRERAGIGGRLVASSLDREVLAVTERRRARFGATLLFVARPA